MRRLTHTLAWLYAIAALALLRCAMVSHNHGSTAYTGFFAATACVLAGAVVHVTVMADEYRFLLGELDRARRAAKPTAPAEDGVVAVALAGACCERWWTSAGAEHDPTTCTRKDQTL